MSHPPPLPALLPTRTPDNLASVAAAAPPPALHPPPSVSPASVPSRRAPHSSCPSHFAHPSHLPWATFETAPRRRAAPATVGSLRLLAVSLLVPRYLGDVFVDALTNLRLALALPVRYRQENCRRRQACIWSPTVNGAPP
jgi:hypothetical protein